MNQIIARHKTSELLRIRGATKSFRTPEGGVVKPLDGIDISIQNNEFLTLLGPSGCGKTTLLKTIAGFEDLDDGEMSLDGQPIGAVPAHRRPFNTVFQNYALFPHMSVAENVGYGLDVAGVARSERQARVADALRLVSLGGMEQRRPSQLSGGQQQRVALARALVNRPRILLLDEPLSALDRKLRQSMQIELKNLQHTVGITFLFVTHDQEEALSMSDRIAVMEHGKILQLGTPDEVYDTPADRSVASFIGTSNILTGEADKAAHGVRIRVSLDLEIIVENQMLTPGSTVDVLLRPEHLVACNSEALPSGHQSFEMVLDNTVFVGSDIHLHGHLRDGQKIIALHRHDKGGLEPFLGQGQVIRLSYSPLSPHVMPRNAGR